jgi:uncharacterized protein (TIGR00369 family)
MPDFKYADETNVTATQLVPQEWANFFGNAHGGQILALVDNTAYVCAARYAGNPVCVTAALDRVDFHEPIFVGELLNLHARIIYVGRTSMEVEIDLWAENISTGSTRLTTSCHVTMVAMKDGKPSPVPRLVPRTREDKARFLRARMRREMSVKHREERDRFMDRVGDMDDKELDALIAEPS